MNPDRKKYRPCKPRVLSPRAMSGTGGIDCRASRVSFLQSIPLTAFRAGQGIIQQNPPVPNYGPRLKRLYDRLGITSCRRKSPKRATNHIPGTSWGSDDFPARFWLPRKTRAWNFLRHYKLAMKPPRVASSLSRLDDRSPPMTNAMPLLIIRTKLNLTIAPPPSQSQPRVCAVWFPAAPCRPRRNNFTSRQKPRFPFSRRRSHTCATDIGNPCDDDARPARNYSKPRAHWSTQTASAPLSSSRPGRAAELPAG